MKRAYASWGPIVLGLFLLALGMYIGIARYRECRAHGFSILYCVPK